MNKCIQCDTPTNNPKFCCCSCAVTYNNTKHPKRKPEHHCVTCGTPIIAHRKFCAKCHKLSVDITLEEAIYTRHHKSSAYCLVRSRARSVAQKLGWNSCQICGYNKHVEISHRKSISQFAPSTMLSEINHPDNLVALCPNCHWEYDHGKLILS